MYFTTDPLVITDAPADANHRGGTRPLASIRCIVIHATAGTNSLKWLTTDPASVVSIHRLIDKRGTIYKIVEDAGVAYHAGFGSFGPYVGPAKTQVNLNAVSLGIEIENLNDGRDPYTDAQYRAVALQIVEWWGKYGFLPVIAHRDTDTRKVDPRGFDWHKLHALLAELVRR